jgi:hypothetical protein
VNSLAKYHFNDKDDVDLLTRLINEENEFVLSCFDVFDSDRDYENLIDSLQRIVNKYKLQEGYVNGISPQAFYAPHESGHSWHASEQ